MDQSGLYVMENILLDLNLKEVTVIFVGPEHQPRHIMERIDIIPDIIPESKIYVNFKAYLKEISK